MTEEQLQDLERADRALYWRYDISLLIAEIRRCWKEIEDLKLEKTWRHGGRG